VVPHPTYGPDLAPSDHKAQWFLITRLEELKFKTDDEVNEEVTNFLNGLAAEFYEERLQKYTDRDG